MFANIVVNRPTHRIPPTGSDPLRDDDSRLSIYTYRLPERLQEGAMVGHLVQVPLRTSMALGVVVDLSDAPPPDLPPESIRQVAEILDPLPVATPAQIDLAYWIADRYLSPLSQAQRLVLPPGLESRTFVMVTRISDSAAGALTAEEKAALRLLRKRGGRVRLSTLLGQIPADDPDAVVHSLADRGLVEARYTLVPPRPAPTRVQYVRLLADDAAIETSLPRLGRSSKQADALLVLARRAHAPITLAELCDLTGSGSSPVRALARRGWVEITKQRTLVLALAEARVADLGSAPKQEMALSVLLGGGGPQEMKELQREAGVSSAVVAALEKKGLVQRIVEEPVVLLTLSPDQVMDRVIELRGSEKYCAVLDALRGTTGRVWVGGLYAQTGADLTTLRGLADRGLVSLHAEEYERSLPIGAEPPPALTPDQEAVWQEVEAGVGQQEKGEEPFIALLHGVTGSGKTEIYMRALESTLAAGRRAIVLVPEISLTAQAVRRFEARFPGRVVVMHSQLSMGQRYAVWDRVRRGEADVVVGPRSALFSPIARLGLIVVDESHDDSYKQSEPIPLPAYNTRDVAIALGRLTGAAILFGSATPDLVTYYRASQRLYRLYDLPSRFLTRVGGAQRAVAGGMGQETVGAAHYARHSLPPVRVVDLRQELRAGNRGILSRALQEALHQTLDAGEQAILFLNRRGTATFVLCRDCGYVARCPDCDVPLTFHHPSAVGGASSSGRLVCHRCNHREPAPSFCPDCDGRRIRYFGLGTERVEGAVRELHPEARLLRWDRDTASGTDHERFLQAFVEHRADVLVGTQMIAKGLDLPLVTLVGVVSADTALHLPDYRAAERTFQLLTQVAGRAGRSQRGGQVIVQTYDPDHYAIQLAAKHDYLGFYQRELAYRRRLGYPPFNRLVALRFSDSHPDRCQAAAERMGRWLLAEIRRLALEAELIGPAPCFFSRVRGRYRWQIVIRAPDPMPLLRNVSLPQGWGVDVDPVSLL